MQPGETITYAGDAHRADDGAAVQVEGVFRFVEERTDDTGTRWLVEDARLGDVFERSEPEPHTYLLPEGAGQAPDPAAGTVQPGG